MEFRVNLLPAAQRALWPRLNAVPADFMLYGGTALALRLGHRESVDFDFFSDRSFTPVELQAEIPLLSSIGLAQAEPNTVTAWVEGVKLSFFGGLRFPVLGSPDHVIVNDIAIASLLDLAGTKVLALLNRVEARDYEDLGALLDAGVLLPEIVAAAQAINGAAPQTVLMTLSYFDEGPARTLSEPLKNKLRQAAGAVRRLPTLPIRHATISEAARASRQ